MRHDRLSYGRGPCPHAALPRGYRQCPARALLPAHPSPRTARVVLAHEVHGKPIAAIAVCWAGDPTAGEQTARPLRTFGCPLADTIVPKAFFEHQTMLDTGQPFGRRYYWKSHNLDAIDDALIETVLDHAQRITSAHSAILCMHLDGLPARLDPEANAVGLRQARHILNIQGAWENGQADHHHMSWVRQLWSAAEPFSCGSGYVNFM